MTTEPSDVIVNSSVVRTRATPEEDGESSEDESSEDESEDESVDEDTEVVVEVVSVVDELVELVLDVDFESLVVLELELVVLELVLVLLLLVELLLLVVLLVVEVEVLVVVELDFDVGLDDEEESESSESLVDVELAELVELFDPVWRLLSRARAVARASCMRSRLSAASFRSAGKCLWRKSCTESGEAAPIRLESAEA